MSNSLLLGLTSVLQYLHKSLDPSISESDIIILCEHLRNHTKDSPILLSLATILSIRHDLVHNGMMKPEDWFRLYRSLVFLESWYRRIENPSDTSPELIIFMTLNQWVLRETINIQNQPVVEHIHSSKDLVSPYDNTGYLMKSTLKEIRDSAWREKIKNYDFCILEGKHEGTIASLKGWQGTSCRVWLKHSDGTKTQVCIGTNKRIGLLKEKHKTRGDRYNAQIQGCDVKIRGTVEDFLKYKGKDHLLGKIIHIYDGQYSGKNGKIINFDGKYSYAKVVGEQQDILLAPSTEIGFYEPKENVDR